MFVKVTLVQVRLTCVSESTSVSVSEIWGGNRLQGVLNKELDGFPSGILPPLPSSPVSLWVSSPGRLSPVGQERPCSSSYHAQLNSETGRACTRGGPASARVLGRTCFQRRVRLCSYRRTEAGRDGKTRKVYSTTLRCSV